MGVGDYAKMAMKARKAQKQMKKIQEVGLSKSIAVVMNGVYKVEAVEVDREVLADDLKELDLDKKAIDKIAKYIEDNVKDSVNEAKKKLEKSLMNSRNLDDLKGMMGI